MKDINDLETAADFREFFEAIPDEKWTVRRFDDGNGCHCAFGHLGVNQRDRGLTKPAIKLKLIAEGIGVFVTRTNDEHDPARPTPRLRILSMLETAIARGM